MNRLLEYGKYALYVGGLALLLSLGWRAWSSWTTSTTEVTAQLTRQTGLAEAPQPIVETPGTATVETADTSGQLTEDVVEERPDATVSVEPGSTQTRLSVDREPVYFPDFGSGGVEVRGLHGSDRIVVTQQPSAFISIQPVLSAGLIYDGTPGLQAHLSPLRVWGLRIGGFGAIYEDKRFGAGVALSTRFLHENLRVTVGGDLVQRRATVGVVWDF